MRRLHKFGTAAVIVIASVALLGSTDNYFFKINKSFEIFGAVFRELTQNYVLELDPEELMKNGIEGMLATLDPYTVYFDETETEDIDVIATGLYTGLGISVALRDSMLTIIGLSDGYTAQRNGLRVGDRIYKIDSAVVLYGTNRDLRKYTKGSIGSNVDIWVLREGAKDTLQIKLTREQIRLKNVTYSGIVADSIGYIRLERFSRGAAEEVRSAIYDLKRSGKLSGLILDLRDNPGGLLESAISICEIFLPKGSQIVTTKGNDSKNLVQYNSMMEPTEPDLPLAALINESSASASEVLAGALQDLDRAIIVGQTSFGKGLVQSVFELPYKNSLKMTTAKYYTPSGRCIQRIEYGKNYSHSGVKEKPDTNVFYTLNGRKVYESKGIKPDSTVVREEFPDFIEGILDNNLLFNWATKYASKLDSIPIDFEIDDEIVEDFKKYLIKEGFDCDSKAFSKLKEFKQLAAQQKLTPKTRKLLDDLEKAIKRESKCLIDEHYDLLADMMEYEMIRRFHPQSEIITRLLKTDRSVNLAVYLLSPYKYQKILASKEDTFNNKKQ